MQPRPILTLLVIELIAQLAWRAGARGVSLGLEGGFLPAWEAPFADAALASFWLAGLGLVVVVGGGGRGGRGRRCWGRRCVFA